MRFLLPLLALLCCVGAEAKVFEIKDPDFRLSPSTGMTRTHWIDAAEYLLDGAFGYVSDLDDPMYFPKQLGKTYPRDEYAIKVAKLEGLVRTLFIAAPLLRENPGLTLHGIKVADYYRHNILSLVTPGKEMYFEPHTTAPSQTLIELGSLCMCLEVAEDALWGTFTPDQRDALAALLKSYGEGPTIDTNWRFFNIFSLSFLKKHGYEVNEDYLRENIVRTLDRYRGEGWYNDAPAYDYYSMWAFQTYGPLWAELYGKTMYPEYAAAYLANQADLIDNYPYMFARDGRMNMWGRSNVYRFACTIPLAMLAYSTEAPRVNYGWMRKISSATLLQFMRHPDFLEDGIPTMGFYGPFAPVVQIYSCRGSVYWMGKAFFNLLLPEDSPYWTAVENDGPWADELLPGAVYNKFQPATSLMITDYPNCGGSEMRSWCHETVAADWQKFRSSENYNKLAYHTEFPWMADGDNGEVSMNYATRNRFGDWEVLRLYDFQDFSDGTYRRRATLETDSCVKYQLADIPLPDGVLRIDKVSVAAPTDVRLGSYSLPETGTPLKAEVEGTAHILDNGEYRLAVVPLHGWDRTFEIYPHGLHPASGRCGVIMNSRRVSGSQVFVTLHLWSKGTGDFSPETMAGIEAVDVAPDNSMVSVTFADGSRKTVNFD